MSAMALGGSLPGLRLYRVAVPPRRIVALLPAQNRKKTLFSAFLEALVQAGQAYAPPKITAMPPCLGGVGRLNPSIIDAGYKTDS